MTLDQVLGPLRADLPFVTTMFVAWGLPRWRRRHRRRRLAKEPRRQ
jgi:hypothetical protein